MTAPFVDDHKPLPMVEKFEKLPPPPPQADYQEPDYVPPRPPPKITSDSNGGPHNLLPPIPTMASIGDLDDSAYPIKASSPVDLIATIALNVPLTSIASSAPPSPSPESKPKKSNPLIDLIETEKLYVDQLTGVIRVRAAFNCSVSTRLI